ncbi:HNH endonuclease signature motif containing protein, partial [Arthrobacter sp. C9C5]|uniref:HNH endonuclease signature motif containing protein n=1 Tax=Arthrobacter sp. C9C5 TaxID=2735267 RepID=UPI00201C2C74
RPQVMVTIDYRDLLERLHHETNINTDTDAKTGPFGTGDATGHSPGVGPLGFTGTGASGRGTGAGAGRRGGDGPGAGPLGFAGTGTLAFTGPVTAATIRKIACDADIIPVLLGSRGRILDVGRTSRIFPPHIRKAITARDQGCAFPGCTIPAPWCEAHHITYWSTGGSTSTNNGTLLCSHHHHLTHKEQWTIQIRAGIPWFIPPPHLDPRQTPRRNHYFRC